MYDILVLGKSIKSIAHCYHIKLANPSKKIGSMNESLHKIIDTNTFYTMEELRKHNKKEDAWIVLTIDGVSCVFNVTKWIPEHPGGEDILIKHLAKDATEKFVDLHEHSDIVYNTLLPTYFIGYLKK